MFITALSRSTFSITAYNVSCIFMKSSQMQVLHVMSFLIEQVQRAIKPYASLLIQYLPKLWEASEEHDLLRCAILTTLVTLVQVTDPF